jgi:hypothetical protein
MFCLAYWTHELLERLNSTHLPVAVNTEFEKFPVAFKDIVKLTFGVIEVIVAFAGIWETPVIAIPTTNPVVLVQFIILVVVLLQFVNIIGSVTDSNVSVSFADASKLAPDGSRSLTD